MGDDGKRISAKAASIEDIWGSVSTIKAADLNPPPARIVLTPRSAEACLRHGVNPETLRIRPLDSFTEQGLDPVIQRMRHEAYTQRRFEMMRLVRGERKKLVNLEASERRASPRARRSSARARATPSRERETAPCLARLAQTLGAVTRSPSPPATRRARRRARCSSAARARAA